MKSYYPGTCSSCGERYPEGTEIIKSGAKWQHVTCPRVLKTLAAPIGPSRVKNPYRKGTMVWQITEQYIAGMSRTVAFTTLRLRRDSLGTDESRRLIFKRNENGRRVPLPENQQDFKLRQAIDREYRKLAVAGNTPSSAPLPVLSYGPPAKAEAKSEDWLYGKIKEATAIANEREHDSIGYRPIIEGARMVKAGLDPMRTLDAMVKNWPNDSRSQLGVMDLPELTNGEALDWIKTLATLSIPIYLKGEAGMGKSYLAKQLARDLYDGTLDMYGECPMSAGASPSWLAGSWTVDHDEPFKTRDFLERYGNGGVFCFEEIDRADANLLTFLNNALAGEAFRNPVSGQTVQKHEDFVVVATANTWGTGATTRYPSAEMLDFSTLDRFRMGRVVIPYDSELADSLWSENRS